MKIKEQLKLIEITLNKAEIDFAIIGGLAVSALGYQRFTNDIDIIVAGSKRVALKEALMPLGYSVFHEDKEFLQLKNGIPLDILFANRELSLAMLKNAQCIKGETIKCLLPEDIIGLKIQSFATNREREHKEKADIQVLAGRNKLDTNKIKIYADLFNVWHEIEPLVKGQIG